MYNLNEEIMKNLKYALIIGKFHTINIFHNRQITNPEQKLLQLKSLFTHDLHRKGNFSQK